mgnify:CR=1 FL=1
MADETKKTTTETEVKDSAEEKNNQEEQTQEQQEQTTPSAKELELMAKVAEAEARAEKLKKANDSLSKSEAEMKRKLRATQTAEEQKKEEEEEAKRLADEERESIKKELNHMKAVAAYKNISEEKTVELLIDAVSEADHAAIMAIIDGEKQKSVKEAKAEWQKSVPHANVGSGDDKQITKEQFDAMGMAEQSKLYRENKAEYDRLKGLK